MPQFSDEHHMDVGPGIRVSVEGFCLRFKDSGFDLGIRDSGTATNLQEKDAAILGRARHVPVPA
jgi:hypothetical protein